MNGWTPRLTIEAFLRMVGMLFLIYFVIYGIMMNNHADKFYVLITLNI